MIDGFNSGDEKDTDTFLTGTKIEDKNNFDNFENSTALVEQNLQANSQNKRRGIQAMQMTQKGSTSTTNMHKRT